MSVIKSDLLLNSPNRRSLPVNAQGCMAAKEINWVLSDHPADEYYERRVVRDVIKSLITFIKISQFETRIKTSERPLVSRT